MTETPEEKKREARHAETVYVGNLPVGITDEGKLRKLFGNFGEVVAVRMGASGSFCFVEYETAEAAQQALMANGTDISGSRIVVSPSVDKQKERKEHQQQQQQQQLPADRSVFVSNLAYDCTEQEVKETLEKAFGTTVETVRLLVGKEGKPKGIGFAVFAEIEGHDRALTTSKQDLPSLHNRAMHISQFTPPNCEESHNTAKQQQQQLQPPPPQTQQQQTPQSLPEERTVFVSSIGYGVLEEELKETMVKEFGEVESVKVLHDRATGKSRGLAFVVFKETEACDKALNAPKDKMPIIRKRQIKINKFTPPSTTTSTTSTTTAAPPAAVANTTTEPQTMEEVTMSAPTTTLLMPRTIKRQQHQSK